MYLAFFKTVLAALFRTFGLLLRFLPLKASFLHDHLITQHSDFSSILAVSSTDKPINRSIHAYAPTWRNVVALRGFIFRDIHKKQRRSSSNSGYRIQKNEAGKYTLARAPLVRKYANRIFESKHSTTRMKIVN